MINWIFRIIYILLLTFYASLKLTAQQIVDPCFLSIETLGRYYGSEDLVNVCQCLERNQASDLLYWDGNEWQGRLSYSEVDIPPPPGCNQRAIWMGNRTWTTGGEGFALRLDKPLEAGKSYSYTFTYAKDGCCVYEAFSPLIYTYHEPPILSNSLRNARYCGRLPAADEWRTETFTFTASQQQAGDNWLILYVDSYPGIVLAGCNFNDLPENFLIVDQLLCEDAQIPLTAPLSKYYSYKWSNGSTESSILASPGEYSVTVTQDNCVTKDSVTLLAEDCEVRLSMPNIFTPNNDALNELFEPIDYNYIESAVLIIYNRWGDQLYSGDLFKGWDGRTNSGWVSSGVYYYLIHYTDKTKTQHQLKGLITVNR